MEDQEAVCVCAFEGDICVKSSYLFLFSEVRLMLLWQLLSCVAHAVQC